MPRLCSTCPYRLRAEGPIKGVICTLVSHDRPGTAPVCDLADDPDRLTLAHAKLRAGVAMRDYRSIYVHATVWTKMADDAQALLDELEGGAECPS